VHKPVTDLSGGQQNRLMLCKLVLAEPDVLILDEPTNHLDIASRQMLEEALADFNGTIIAVSHDRYFLDRIAESLLILGAGADGMRKTGSMEMILAPAADMGGVYSTYAQKVQRQKLLLEKEKIELKRKSRPAAAQAPKVKTPEHLRPFNKYTPEQIEEMVLEQNWRLNKCRTSSAMKKFSGIINCSPSISLTLRPKRDILTCSMKHGNTGSQLSNPVVRTRMRCYNCGVCMFSKRLYGNIR